MHALINDAFPRIALGVAVSRRAQILLHSASARVDSGGQVQRPEGRSRSAIAAAAWALLSNIPIVITADRKTFWSKRELLAQWGVQVLRPTELLDRYIPYWNAVDDECADRRGDQSA